MADEYIRRDDAVEALAKTMPTPATPDGAGEFDNEIHIADEAFADAIRIIKSLEPADVAPVVHGEWIHMGCGVFECDKCGERISTNVYVKEKASARFKFCPSCGANMIGEQE